MNACGHVLKCIHARFAVRYTYMMCVFFQTAQVCLFVKHCVVTLHKTCSKLDTKPDWAKEGK